MIPIIGTKEHLAATIDKLNSGAADLHSDVAELVAGHAISHTDEPGDDDEDSD